MVLPLFIAYVGPETVLPVASVVASIIGLFLMLGKRSLKFMTGTLKAIFRR